MIEGYKGYTAKVHVDPESGKSYGKIEGIRDLVTFEAEQDAQAAFCEAVEDYLDFCLEIGKEPERP